MKMKQLLLAISVALSFTLTAPACASAPPAITTQSAKIAFNADQAIGYLRAVRTAVVSANQSTDPVVHLRDADAEVILVSLRASMQTIAATPDGWQSIVKAAWDATKQALPAEQRARLGQYIVMVDALLLGVK